MNAIRSLLVFPVLLLMAAPASAQMQGTLFTLPDERVYLDYLRDEFLLRNAEAGFDIEEVEIPEIPEEEVAAEQSGPIEFSYGGIMTTRDGRRNILLNGRLLPEQELPPGISIVAGERSASLRITQDGNIFVLRPGHAVNLATGVVIENFQRPQPEPPVQAAQPAPEETPVTEAETPDGASATEEETAEDTADSSAADDAEAAPEEEAAEGPSNEDRNAILAEALSQMNAEDVEQLVENLQLLQEQNADDEP